MLLAAALMMPLTACRGDDDDDDGGGDADDAKTTEQVWTDEKTGLTWPLSASTDAMNWPDAGAFCADLTYGGTDDWRLPTISELRTLIRGCEATQTGGSCGVTDECVDFGTCFDEICLCEGALSPNYTCYEAGEFDDPCRWYWSSTEAVDMVVYVWVVEFT
ncbi:MAG: DUF1566 domain-containing protein [Deltaproteobacteria bacterium]|nr:DUF1566 domain-containing protein [Deltaproteobacteria bacterium]